MVGYTFKYLFLLIITDYIKFKCPQIVEGKIYFFHLYSWNLIEKQSFLNISSTLEIGTAP